MDNNQKILRLSEIFKNQIDWYKTRLEKYGESYVYDESSEQFNALKARDFAEILSILSQ